MNDVVLETLRVLPSRLKSAWVFPSGTGETPLDARNFYNRVFVPALERADIRDFHWHDLRHSFASRLVMAGVDLRTVQEVMGHKTITMTMRYSHLSSGHQLDAVQRLTSRPTGTTTGTSIPTDALSTKPPKGIEPSTCRLRMALRALSLQDFQRLELQNAAVLARHETHPRRTHLGARLAREGERESLALAFRRVGKAGSLAHAAA